MRWCRSVCWLAPVVPWPVVPCGPRLAPCPVPRSTFASLPVRRSFQSRGGERAGCERSELLNQFVPFVGIEEASTVGHRPMHWCSLGLNMGHGSWVMEEERRETIPTPYTSAPTLPVRPQPGPRAGVRGHSEDPNTPAVPPRRMPRRQPLLLDAPRRPCTSCPSSDYDLRS